MIVFILDMMKGQDEGENSTNPSELIKSIEKNIGQDNKKIPSPDTSKDSFKQVKQAIEYINITIVIMIIPI